MATESSQNLNQIVIKSNVTQGIYNNACITVMPEHAIITATTTAMHFVQATGGCGETLIKTAHITSAHNSYLEGPALNKC